LLLEHSSPGSQRVAGLASLTAGDYRYALSPLVGFMLVGLIASLLAKETLTDTSRR
jgi:predicted benzoate:H+ symporter BenE